jgi:hypothetical protein
MVCNVCGNPDGPCRAKTRDCSFFISELLVTSEDWMVHFNFLFFVFILCYCEIYLLISFLSLHQCIFFVLRIFCFACCSLYFFTFWQNVPCYVRNQINMICAGRTDIPVSDESGSTHTFNVAMNESVTSFYGWGWKEFLMTSNSKPGDFLMFQM